MQAELKVTCPFCSLLCTDIRIIIDRGRLAAFTPECALGRAGFDRSLTSPSYEKLDSADIGIDNARAWLREAHQPLILLSSGNDCETTSAAVALAKKYSAVLNCDDDNLEAVFNASVQAAGMLTGTLGSLQDLDLILLCGTDTVNTHPRLEDVLTHGSAGLIQKFNPNDPLTAIRLLRLANTNPGINLPVDLAFLSRCTGESRQGLVIFDSNWLRLGQSFIEELLFWLVDLNRSGRWFVLYLSAGTNSTGIAETLLSETGCPGNLRFTQMGLDHSPTLWRAEPLIEQGMIDLCLLVGDFKDFTEILFPKCYGIRTILISPESPKMKPNVWLPCAQPGISAQSTFLRFDGLPIKLHPIKPSQNPSMAEILTQLTQAEP